MPQLLHRLGGGAVATTALFTGLAHAEAPLPATLAAATAGSTTTQQRVEITGQPLRRADFAAVRGRYTLSDGRTLEVGGRRAQPTAEVGRQRAVPLVPLSATSFVSTDGTLRLDFAAAPNGVVTQVALTEPRR